MAVLLNQTSSLRVRLDLVRRLSDGVRTPAALEMQVAVERYQHRPRGEHRFLALLEVEKATLLDLDLIQFLQSLEALLEGAAGREAEAAREAETARADGTSNAAPREEPFAALEASVDPAIGLRLVGGPDAFLVEAGVDLLNVLEKVGELEGERGTDLALFRFVANKRAALAFCAQLLEEFGRFPTDPQRVSPGEPG